IFMDYARYVSVLKWLTLALFAYFGTIMVVRIPWTEAARGFLIPTLTLDAAFWTTVVAILGTTISPYLFFWQAAQEVEDIRAVPELAGSAAYAIGEARRWPLGLARQPKRAKAFYATLTLATMVGVGINFSPINPIKALYWSAVINGVVAVPVMITMMHITGNPK